jgi:single-strand DNA-binding protein
MPYINAAQISGNLGKDAETMTTQGGRTITRFSIASTKKWTDKANKTHESTDWFRVAAWGNLTKFASSLKKGDPVLVQGELRTGEYTDEKKVTRQTVELIAQTILRIDCTKLGVAAGRCCGARGLTAVRAARTSRPYHFLFLGWQPFASFAPHGNCTSKRGLDCDLKDQPVRHGVSSENLTARRTIGSIIRDSIMRAFA